MPSLGMVTLNALAAADSVIIPVQAQYLPAKGMTQLKYGDLRADAVHHDGTNHYLYRVYKDTATDSQIENLKAKIYDGKATRADITRVTRRLGDEIAAVYGFDIPRQKKNIERAR